MNRRGERPVDISTGVHVSLAASENIINVYSLEEITAGTFDLEVDDDLKMFEICAKESWQFQMVGFCEQ